ncbi:hypothetical protein CfE428DRAFT_5801 [Chthoniobacter flavus Ellin428]|uniref:Uncharacterized protein n=1 Tax=Chthoniobacter flavus Ellin428 TaxID=497964 RepID=B4DA61_9BACT|nr:hypothetical protein [Chthoniobacter flavus]EDY16688.1 hypothetical protein CfE428DRAFT_5801 [Chthoniobacter flavus Ellin428]TCO87261.1 hypothetical protein EV701_12398 [Chthoniobacter flavus]
MKRFIIVLRLTWRLIVLGKKGTAIIEQTNFWSKQLDAIFDDLQSAHERRDYVAFSKAYARWQICRRRYYEEGKELHRGLTEGPDSQPSTINSQLLP